jgi:hypothetical protein
MRARTVLAAVVLAATLGAACSSGSTGSDAEHGQGPAVQPADEGIDGVVAIRIPSAKHVRGEIDYDRRPPAGGDHNPIPVKCGFYDEEIPDEFLVHSLEHGAVWLAYSPTLDAAAIDVVHSLVRANPETLATPYPGLDAGTAVVATAWARQLALTSVDDPRLAEFVARYQDGDQAPEAGIACAGQGAGEPLP